MQPLSDSSGRGCLFMGVLAVPELSTSKLRRVQTANAELLAASDRDSSTASIGVLRFRKMMKSSHLLKTAFALVFLMPFAAAVAADSGKIKAQVDRIILPLMEQQGIPGMAVAIVREDGSTVFNYGVASKQTGKPVDDETLFEIGSISKTFTATLAAYAAEKGKLKLSDPVSAHMPELKGSAVADVAVLHLATHTPGGMPLQFPAEVTNHTQMMQYFKDWKPAHPPGTYRTYANPSVGLLGVIAARSMGRSFTDVMQSEIFSKLGLRKTFVNVSPAEEDNYAQGYTRNDQQARMSPGVLAGEAYGVKTTASDLARFVAIQMEIVDVPADMQSAIEETRKGYFKASKTTQALIWEQYDHPAKLEDLIAGNSTRMSMQPNAVTAIEPPLEPQPNVLVNKTGSTSGFGGYVAFLPAEKLGIVMLANKNYPNEARVEAAFKIMAALAKADPAD